MKTEEEARFEFDNLRSDDPVFDSNWGCNDEEQQEKNFYEWCSMYDDTKHIKERIKMRNFNKFCISKTSLLLIIDSLTILASLFRISITVLISLSSSFFIIYPF